jgi:DNA/RNA endonuclease G (NUC1)
MLRSVTVLVLVLSACQSIERRVEPRTLQPDKTSGPKFDEDEASQSAVNTSQGAPGPKDDPKPLNAESTVSSEPKGESVVILGGSLNANANLPFGPVAMTGYESSWLLLRDQYVISWNPTTKNPNWVSWILSPSDLGSLGRQDHFTVDSDLKFYLNASGSSVTPVTSSDYAGTCLDRGHMVPSSDRQASETDNIATFHMTNIIPQTAFNNQRIWKGLEDEARRWLDEGTYPRLWIIAGPAYAKTLHYTATGVAIPSATFKLIYSWDKGKHDKPFLLKAILVPNMTSKGTLAYDDRTRLCAEARSGGLLKGETIERSMDYNDYQATVLEIETAAHMQLPDLAH